MDNAGVAVELVLVSTEFGDRRYHGEFALNSYLTVRLSRSKQPFMSNQLDSRTSRGITLLLQVCLILVRDSLPSVGLDRANRERQITCEVLEKARHVCRTLK